MRIRTSISGQFRLKSINNSCINNFCIKKRVFYWFQTIENEEDNQIGPCPSILKVSIHTGIRHLDTEILADFKCRFFAKKWQKIQKYERQDIFHGTPIRVFPPESKAVFRQEIDLTGTVVLRL